ncbi:hypothetical protein F2P81_015412 [Scophthalmus maximus]|uniref:Uncharacterized protein n=1 Tax=Scophthalmus maximus TaxID=52904 RepID=A0A6A4SS93_SCOMX|nr:hypothetical protein F2P81_015412 [Scophthalmus maximus]
MCGCEKQICVVLFLDVFEEMTYGTERSRSGLLPDLDKEFRDTEAAGSGPDGCSVRSDSAGRAPRNWYLERKCLINYAKGTVLIHSEPLSLKCNTNQLLFVSVIADRDSSLRLPPSTLAGPLKLWFSVSDKDNNSILCNCSRRTRSFVEFTPQPSQVLSLNNRRASHGADI